MKRAIRRFAALVGLTAILAAASMNSIAQNTYTLPLVLPAGGAVGEGFVRITNLTGQSGRVVVRAFDDTGRRFGPFPVSLRPWASFNFRAGSMERWIGNGTGNWRLRLETSLNIRPLAYARTADGFLTAMHDATTTGRNHSVPIFNPASNRHQVSRLRLINKGSSTARITINGRDDAGGRRGPVVLSLPGGDSRTLTAQQLEAGTGLSGRLGNGAGLWSLTVASNVDIEVMSLLTSARGLVSNLTTAPAGTPPDPEPPPPPPPPPPPGDHHGNTRSTATEVSTSSRTPGRIDPRTDLDYFRVDLPRSGRLVVRTTGSLDTFGRLYRGSQYVTFDDNSGSGRNFSITRQSVAAGTWYVLVKSYDERTTGNYTLHVEFTGGTTPPPARRYYGAFATRWYNESTHETTVHGRPCVGAYALAGAFNALTFASARQQAERACNQYVANRGGPSSGCSVRVYFESGTQRRCGAVAIGSSGRGCTLIGRSGATQRQAESAAISACRSSLGGGTCSIVSTETGTASHCLSAAASRLDNSGGGLPQLPEAQYAAPVQ